MHIYTNIRTNIHVRTLEYYFGHVLSLLLFVSTIHFVLFLYIYIFFFNFRCLMLVDGSGAGIHALAHEWIDVNAWSHSVNNCLFKSFVLKLLTQSIALTFEWFRVQWRYASLISLLRIFAIPSPLTRQQIVAASLIFCAAIAVGHIPHDDTLLLQAQVLRPWARNSIHNTTGENTHTIQCRLIVGTRVHTSHIGAHMRHDRFLSVREWIVFRCKQCFNNLSLEFNNNLSLSSVSRLFVCNGNIHETSREHVRSIICTYTSKIHVFIMTK